MSVDHTSSVGHPICLAFLDAVVLTEDQGYRFDPRALPGLEERLRALCSDQSALLEGIFALLDLASLLRAERSPAAADDVVHLVVACCSETLRAMGSAGQGVLSSFDTEPLAREQRQHELLGLEPVARAPRGAPAPGSIPGPLARLATAADSGAKRRRKKVP